MNLSDDSFDTFSDEEIRQTAAMILASAAARLEDGNVTASIIMTKSASEWLAELKARATMRMLNGSNL